MNCLSNLLSIFKPSTRPDITFYKVDSQVVADELNALNIQLLYSPMDTQYYYTTEWGWRQAIDYIRKVHNFPNYQDQKFDCDDFAILMKGLVSQEFGMNTCAFIIGNMGAHAFNLVRTENGWKILEPQTGGFVTDYTMSKYLL